MLSILVVSLSCSKKFYDILHDYCKNVIELIQGIRYKQAIGCDPDRASFYLLDVVWKGLLSPLFSCFKVPWGLL
jgi:hypothetical protein